MMLPLGIPVPAFPLLVSCTFDNRPIIIPGFLYPDQCSHLSLGTSRFSAGLVAGAHALAERAAGTASSLASSPGPAPPVPQSSPPNRDGPAASIPQRSGYTPTPEWTPHSHRHPVHTTEQSLCTLPSFSSGNPVGVWCIRIEVCLHHSPAQPPFPSDRRIQQSLKVDSFTNTNYKLQPSWIIPYPSHTINGSLDY